MSNSFRPVIEKWGHHSSSFLDSSEDVATVLKNFADECGVKTELQHEEYHIRLWMEYGKPVLKLMASLKASQIESIAKIYSDKFGDEVGALQFLLENIRALAGKEWKKSIGTHGELIFYID